MATSRAGALTDAGASEESLVKALELCGYVRRDQLPKRPPVSGGDPDAPTKPWGRDDSLGDDPLDGGSPDSIVTSPPLNVPEFLPNGRVKPNPVFGRCSADAVGVLWSHIAEVRATRGNHTEAVRDFRRALAFRPELVLDTEASAAAKKDFDDAAKAPQPESRTGSTSISGHLKLDQLRAIVDPAIGAFRYCYEEELVLNPRLAGTVTVSFVIGADGSVNSTGGGGLGAVGRCVVNAFRGLTFPRPEGGIVAVTYPLSLHPSRE
jgi:hypothetical protein